MSLLVENQDAVTLHFQGSNSMGAMVNFTNCLLDVVRLYNRWGTNPALNMNILLVYGSTHFLISHTWVINIMAISIILIKVNATSLRRTSTWHSTNYMESGYFFIKISVRDFSWILTLFKILWLLFFLDMVYNLSG